jgi:hypothetical protein
MRYIDRPWQDRPRNHLGSLWLALRRSGLSEAFLTAWGVFLGVVMWGATAWLIYEVLRP